MVSSTAEFMHRIGLHFMIRKATVADRPRISEVRLAVRENQLNQASVAKVDATADWIFRNATFWVWEEAGAVQGFSVADPRDGTIFGLFIHPDYEGRGLARALLPLACADLKAAGFAVATLTTGPGTRAELFYRRNGWEEIGRQENGEIIFRKAL
jgi:GNAT superfamily N-acetyltransferase